MTDHIIVVAMSLPLGTTPKEVSELLWTRIGMSVDPTLITCKQNSRYSASAFIRVTEEVLVDFLNRNFSDCVLDGQREAVRFEEKIWKSRETLNRQGIRQL